MGEKMGTVAEPILINVMQLFCSDNLEHLHNKALVLKMEQVCISICSVHNTYDGLYFLALFKLIHHIQEVTYCYKRRM